MDSASEAWKNIRAIYLVALCCIGYVQAGSR
jgi:hypothetical protein